MNTNKFLLMIESINKGEVPIESESRLWDLIMEEENE